MPLVTLEVSKQIERLFLVGWQSEISLIFQHLATSNPTNFFDDTKSKPGNPYKSDIYFDRYLNHNLAVCRRGLILRSLHVLQVIGLSLSIVSKKNHA